MHELLRSNDAVLINFTVVLLRDAGLRPLLVDEHMSAIEGSIGALPRRVLIAEDEMNQAMRVMRESSLSNWITSDAER